MVYLNHFWADLFKPLLNLGSVSQYCIYSKNQEKNNCSFEQ